jgi:hypothetical protein
MGPKRLKKAPKRRSKTSQKRAKSRLKTPIWDMAKTGQNRPPPQNRPNRPKVDITPPGYISLLKRPREKVLFFAFFAVLAYPL